MEFEEVRVVEEQLIIDKNSDLGSVLLYDEEYNGSEIDNNPEY